MNKLPQWNVCMCVCVCFSQLSQSSYIIYASCWRSGPSDHGFHTDNLSIVAPTECNVCLNTLSTFCSQMRMSSFFKLKQKKKLDSCADFPFKCPLLASTHQAVVPCSICHSRQIFCLILMHSLSKDDKIPCKYNVKVRHILTCY